MTNAKFKVPPDIHIYSKNVESKMVFVHTGNGSSEVYYPMASRINDDISFAVIESFNLYHPHEATYGINNLAEEILHTLPEERRQKALRYRKEECLIRSIGSAFLIMQTVTWQKAKIQSVWTLKN